MTGTDIKHGAQSKEKQVDEWKRQKRGDGKEGRVEGIHDIKWAIMSDTENLLRVSGKTEETGEMREDWFKWGK